MISEMKMMRPGIVKSYPNLYVDITHDLTHLCGLGIVNFVQPFVNTRLEVKLLLHTQLINNLMQLGNIKSNVLILQLKAGRERYAVVEIHQAGDFGGDFEQAKSIRITINGGKHTIQAIREDIEPRLKQKNQSVIFG
jgi:hypothetical protein